MTIKYIQLEKYNNKTGNRYIKTGIIKVSSALTIAYTQVFQ